MLLAKLLVSMDEFASSHKNLRRRALADVRAVLASLPARARGRVQDMLAVEIEHSFQKLELLRILGKKLAKQAVAKHTVEVEGHNKCLGANGGGVTVTIGNVTADACVTGSPGSGLTGGGLSGGFRY